MRLSQALGTPAQLAKPQGWFLFAIVGGSDRRLGDFPERPRGAARRYRAPRFRPCICACCARSYPRPLAADVVLIGIDGGYREGVSPSRWPLAPPLRRRCLHALAKAKPRAVGVDVTLPERTFEGIVPGLDLAMMRGLADAKRAAPLVYALTVDSRGRPVPIQPNYAGIVQPENAGFDQQLSDPDNVSRRFSEREISGTAEATERGGQLRRALKIPCRSGTSIPASFPVTSVRCSRPTWTPEAFEVFASARPHRYLTGINWTGDLALKSDGGQASGAARDEGRAATGAATTARLPHPPAVPRSISAAAVRPVPEWARWLMCVFVSLIVFVRRAVAGDGRRCSSCPPWWCCGLAAIVNAQVLLRSGDRDLFWFSLVARGVFDAIEAAWSACA